MCVGHLGIGKPSNGHVAEVPGCSQPTLLALQAFQRTHLRSKTGLVSIVNGRGFIRPPVLTVSSTANLWCWSAIATDSCCDVFFINQYVTSVFDRWRQALKDLISLPLNGFRRPETRMNACFEGSGHRTLPSLLPSKKECFCWCGRWAQFAGRLLQRINRQLRSIAAAWGWTVQPTRSSRCLNGLASPIPVVTLSTILAPQMSWQQRPSVRSGKMAEAR